MTRGSLAAALGALALTTLGALPAPAGDVDFDLAETEKEIAAIIDEEFRDATVLPMSATAAIGLLEQLGYSGIESFEVHAHEYDIEATSPGGRAVQIEMDPLTGDILEVAGD